jgi:DNA topoisomerase-1
MTEPIYFHCLEAGCTGYLTEHTTKGGKPFYGCSNFPQCNFVIFDEIVSLPCPICGADYLLIKNKSSQGESLYICASPCCEFKSTEADY